MWQQLEVEVLDGRISHGPDVGGSRKSQDAEGSMLPVKVPVDSHLPGRAIQRLPQHICLLVEQRRPDDAARKHAWQTLSTFIFLRGLVLAIPRPHCFELVPHMPKPAIQRRITLVGESSSPANLNVSGARSEPVRIVKDMLTRKLPTMNNMLLAVFTLRPTPSALAAPASLGPVDALKHQGIMLIALTRDPPPRLADLVYLPRHLTLAASAVVRRPPSSATLQPPPSHPTYPGPCSPADAACRPAHCALPGGQKPRVPPLRAHAVSPRDERRLGHPPRKGSGPTTAL
jgi:hypothetical protein